MRKRIIGISLGVASLVATAGATFAFNMNSKAQEVRAASPTRLYLDTSGFADWHSSSASFKVHTWNNANGDKYFPVTRLNQGSDVCWYADVDLATYANGGGYRFTRYNSDGSTEWNKGAWQTYADGVKTYYYATGWTAGTWSNNDQKSWSIKGSASGNWTGGSDDIDITLTKRIDDEGLQFYSTNVVLPAGAQFKVVNTTDNDWLGFNKMETNDLGKTYLTGKNDSNISVGNGGGTFEIYMKPSTGKFWAQVSSITEATTFSSNFLSATNSICSSGSTSADHSSALLGIWSAQTTAWNKLTSGAKNAFKVGTANSTITNAHDRYVHIMTRYSETLDDFEGGPSYAGVSSPLKNVKSTATSQITGLAVIGGLAIGGAAMLIRFRAKRQKAE